ncbi:dehydrogenase [Sphaerisporangium melleum]|uniref:Dehydrogenase n=1 Tax=Sphaerisporangium melleum TaxID=321316 RepID=A0A917VF07_9ACTN|nr:2-hydroxyacid dehydrogenase [Sphaerisporangium melleum]GGK70593.1 dehydrogenase [Sphaerisporangium melleum]GII70273.1 dehydrogenase [Sphaerisporangium melleum]
MKIWAPWPAIVEALADLPDVECVLYEGGDTPPEGAEDVEVWIPPLIPPALTAELLGRMGKLRLVQTVTAGVEAYRAHLPEGVILCNARGVHDAATAEWAVGAMIAVTREFPGFAAAQQRGEWTYHITGVLADSTVLIVGYGSIGQALERRLDGFEVEVLRVARTPREGVYGEADLPALLPRADVVVLLVPQTPGTAGLVDAAFLAGMKDGAVLVNAARGSVVDTAALLAEVNSGRLRAALDVTDPEPLPGDHPLWSAPGVFITPHIAGSNPASRRRAVKLMRSQMLRYLSGEPLNNVITGAY